MVGSKNLCFGAPKLARIDEYRNLEALIHDSEQLRELDDSVLLFPSARFLLHQDKVQQFFPSPAMTSTL